ncbi:hypothetical protein FIBSPDRAFT_979106 [Athelia psychrophila]|uniref:Uncharacterized protein n=1 Tax=Athelia psychrophila TaxID=1759441 RepID=A0A166DSJ8_9AGAM|nr:hypothetical protein FIBSPDRAFT_979106 [Fibularhizoctonia sp. CBS 109695]
MSVDIRLDVRAYADCAQQEELQPSEKGEQTEANDKEADAEDATSFDTPDSAAIPASTNDPCQCSRMKAYGKMMEKRLTIEEEHATHRDAKEMKRTAITILGWARVVGGTKQTSRNQHRRATSSSRMSRNIYSLAPSAVPYADMRSDPPIPRDGDFHAGVANTSILCHCTANHSRNMQLPPRLEGIHNPAPTPARVLLLQGVAPDRARNDSAHRLGNGLGGTGHAQRSRLYTPTPAHTLHPFLRHGLYVTFLAVAAGWMARPDRTPKANSIRRMYRTICVRLVKRVQATNNLDSEMSRCS